MIKKIHQSILKELFSGRSRGIDRILVFRFFKLLHGRFWGLGLIFSGALGVAIGYAIRPDFIEINTPLSQLGTDIRTAPFFAGSVFISAYSLWRWRLYLARTLKNPRPVIPLISLTILGLYLIALMPVTWEVWPRRVHFIGVILTGISMSLTVLVDGLLSNNRHSSHAGLWNIVKIFSFFMIFIGGVITVLSADAIDKLQYILLGEVMMFSGYSSWIVLKVSLGEGRQSAIGRIVNKLLR